MYFKNAAMDENVDDNEVCTKKQEEVVVLELSSSEDEDSKEEYQRKQIAEFKRRRDSLRIGVSKVAAMSGLNPHTFLPHLLQELVYQGCPALLKQDAALLDISLVSDELDILMDEIRQSGVDAATAAGIRQTLRDVRSGKRHIPNAGDAAGIRKGTLSTIERQTGKLNARRRRMLEESIRSVVDTSYGTHNENDALDLYERQTGCEVRSRNSGLMIWDFGLKEKLQNNNENAADHLTEPTALELIPLGSGRPLTRAVARRQRRRRRPSSNCVVEKALADDCNNEKPSRSPNNEKPLPDEALFEAASQSVREMEEPKKYGTKRRGSRRSGNLTNHPSVDAADLGEPKPFCSLVGVVDGIRDDLVFCSRKASNTECEDSPEGTSPNTERREIPRVSPTFLLKDDEAAGDDHEILVEGDNALQSRKRNAPQEEEEASEEEELMLRPVIVECKHRMKRAFNPPPLYDQVQAAIYCLMYSVEEADLVQVVRRSGSRCATEKQDTEAGRADSNRQRGGDSVGENTLAGVATPPPASQDLIDSKTKVTKESLPLAAKSNHGGRLGSKEKKTKKEKGKGTDQSLQTKSLLSFFSSVKKETLDGATMGAKCESGAPKEKSRTSTVSTAETAVVTAEGCAPRENPIELTATRVSLDDSLLQHRSNFFSIVLPRLASFVQAAYAVRSDDAKRYRLLHANCQAASSEWKEVGEAAGWEVLLQECPWLCQCDIPLPRQSFAVSCSEPQT